MATLTITTTGAQDSRIVAAFGKRLNLGRDATAAEVKAAVIQFVVGAVVEQEQLAAAATIQPFTPT